MVLREAPFWLMDRSAGVVDNQFGTLVLANTPPIFDGVAFALKVSGCAVCATFFYVPSTVGVGDDVICFSIVGDRN